MSATEAQRVVIADVLAAFYEAIRDAGPSGIPSGHLYAMVCDKVSLGTYEQVIKALKSFGLVHEHNYVLTVFPD